MHRFGAQRRHRQRSARLRCYTATLSHQLLCQWRLLFRVQHRNDSQVYGAPETVPAAACRSASGTVAASLPQRTLDFSWAGSESLPFSVAFDSQWVSYKSLSCPIISAAWPACCVAIPMCSIHLRSKRSNARHNLAHAHSLKAGTGSGKRSIRSTTGHGTLSVGYHEWVTCTGSMFR